MTGITLDAGALIAIDKNDRRVVTALRVALDAEVMFRASGFDWRKNG